MRLTQRLFSTLQDLSKEVLLRQGVVSDQETFCRLLLELILHWVV